MMQWKHTLVISFFGVRSGWVGVGGKGREGGGNSVFTFFSIYSKSLRKCTENVLKSFENHEKSSTSMKLS